MAVLTAQVQGKFEQLVSATKKRYLQQQGINWLPLALTTLAIMLIWTQSWLLSSVVALMVFVIVLLALTRTKAYRSIDPGNMLLHYNRQFPELEESAHLLLAQPSSLLQGLQAQKIEARLAQLIANGQPQLLPRYPVQKGLLRALITAVLLLSIGYLDLSGLMKASPSPTDSAPSAQSEIAPVGLLSSTVSISPPVYTGQSVRKVSELNLKVISGSHITWQLLFTDASRNYYIQFDGGKREPLSRQSDNSFSFDKLVTRTGVYAVSSEGKSLEGIFTISVVADEKPTIHIISPQATVTEYPKNLLPEVTTEVEIEDDFGLSKIEIVASVAKGSGEAVKFRDQLFSFDTSATVDGKPHYYKTWRLTEMGMEPGDELYFSVSATDNREPQPQQSRSQTKIIRWLEEAQNLVLGDGILIDFIPEYFKSQRQIIIETEQLIADESNLTPAEFARTSKLLGNAQSDLKEKYGQYLGDEVDDGSGGHEMEAGAEFSPDETQHEDEEHHDSKDKSGFSRVIEQYGHAHGDAEIGIITKLSPVGLMKRAIANMWQAELHLMLSEPQQALPFEKQALQFLNQAKKAERIYVKRLGFEPPPVSENRRYQGEQKEILSYQRIEKTILNSSKAKDIVQLLQAINKLQNLPAEEAKSGTDENLAALIASVKQQMISLTRQRPELVEYVAILQRMEQEKTLYLAQCDDCLERLTRQLWQLVPATVSSPVTKDVGYLYENNSLVDYGEFLRQKGKMKP